jgi:hypothetical protein
MHLPPQQLHGGQPLFCGPREPEEKILASGIQFRQTGFSHHGRKHGGIVAEQGRQSTFLPKAMRIV